MESEDRIDRVRSRAETAARLNVSLRTLRRLELRGEIERVQITERIIGYRDSAIERFLEERTGRPDDRRNTNATFRSADWRLS